MRDVHNAASHAVQATWLPRPNEAMAHIQIAASHTYTHMLCFIAGTKGSSSQSTQRLAVFKCRCCLRGAWRGLAPAATQATSARPVKAVPVRVIVVAKGNSAAASSLAGEWEAKIKRYVPLFTTQIRPNPQNSSVPAAAVDAEGQKVLKHLKPQDRTIVLDERGRKISSHQMAELIAEAGDRNSSQLNFCIGGPFGHSDAIRQRADDTISLSSLVLNHQVAHIVLLEQIYRAWTILRGEPYHH